MRRLKNEAGFNLMAVAAISALVGLTALTITMVVNHIFRSSKNASAIIATGGIQNLAMALLSNANLCDSALRTYVGATDPITPPTPTTSLTIWPPGPNPNANITIDSLEMVNAGVGTGLIWRGMALGNLGNRMVTISKIIFSTTQGGTDLSAPVPLTVSDTNGNPVTYDTYPGWITIWFSEPTGGLASIQIPLRLMMNQSNGTLGHCTSSDSLAQICMELGGAMSIDGTFQCVQTLYSKIMANPICDAAHVTSTPVPPNNPPQDNGCTVIPSGCGPVYAFTGFSLTGIPRCTCQLLCMSP